MTTLAEFLTACVDEDERDAEEFQLRGELPPHWEGLCDPAQMLREVAFKRKILARHCDDGHGYCAGCGASEMNGDPVNGIGECPELLDMAAVFADRPGYQEAISGISR